jgi:hypothetical protein
MQLPQVRLQKRMMVECGEQVGAIRHARGSSRSNYDFASVALDFRVLRAPARCDSRPPSRRPTRPIRASAKKTQTQTVRSSHETETAGETRSGVPGTPYLTLRNSVRAAFRTNHTTISRRLRMVSPEPRGGKADLSELCKPDCLVTAVWVFDDVRHDIEAVLIE